MYIRSSHSCFKFYSIVIIYCTFGTFVQNIKIFIKAKFFFKTLFRYLEDSRLTEVICGFQLLYILTFRYCFRDVNLNVKSVKIIMLHKARYVKKKMESERGGGADKKKKKKQKKTNF